MITITMDETEKRFNEYVWYVLKQLKEEILATGAGKPIVYDYSGSVIGPGIPPRNRKEQIIRRLEDWGCLKVISQTNAGWPPYYFELEIIPVKFEEVYTKFRNLVSPPTPIAEEKKILPLSKYQSHTENLQRIYNSFIDLPQKDFFRGIADYVQFIDETEDMEPLVKRISEKMESAQQDLVYIEGKLKEEVFDRFDELKEILSKNDLTDSKIKEAVGKFEGVVSKNTQYTSPLEEALYSSLSDIVRAFVDSGQYELVSNYVELDDKGNIKAFRLAPSYDDYRAELENFRSLKNKTIWGSWNELILVYLLVHKYKEELERIRKNNDFWHEMSFIENHKMIEAVLEGKDVDLNHFKKDLYVYNVNKVHNFFIQQLERMGSYAEMAVNLSNQYAAYAQRLKIPLVNLQKQMRAASYDPLIKVVEDVQSSARSALGTISLQDFNYVPYDPIYTEDWVRADSNRFMEQKNKVNDNDDDEIVYPDPHEGSEIPDGWQLGESTILDEAYIFSDGEVMFTFSDRWSKKYQYFKHIWLNFGKKVSYEDTYNCWVFATDADPTSKKKYVRNDRIRRIINMLKKEMEGSPLSVFEIRTNKSFQITLK